MALSAGIALAGQEWEPPNPYNNTWVVGENNRLYARLNDDHGGLFHLMPQVPALPAGERVVGLDYSDGGSWMGPAFGWYFLTASGKVFAANTFDSNAMMWNITQLGGQAPVALSGSGYGFDLDGNHAYVTTTAGQSLLFDMNTNLWSPRPGLVRAGQSAAIGGLAVFDSRGADRFIGLDITDSTVVRLDIENGAVAVDGPAQYWSGVGDPLPLPFAGSTVAGYDSILFANIWDPSARPLSWFGGVALNEPGQAHTRLYPFGWYSPGAGLSFQAPVDLIAENDPSLRFTAIAFSPTPGATLTGVLGMAFAFRRSRRS